MGKRHLTPQEIIAQCKRAARMNQKSVETSLHAMGIIFGYTLMKSEGFNGNKLSKLAKLIDDTYEKLWSGETTLEELSDRLMEKAGWTIQRETYTEENIKARNGKYEYWLAKSMLSGANSIDYESVKYMISMYNVLIDEFGYGQRRLTRVREAFEKNMIDYENGKATLKDWKMELYNKEGVIFAVPNVEKVEE